jgi:uncharacterized protein
LKDAARLLAYFAATILFGALAAPLLYWAAQGLAARGIFPALASFEFESFFHRALIVGALAFLWPFLRWLHVKGRRDLGLEPNKHWLRDLAVGFLLSTVPVVCCEIFLVQRGVYSMRPGQPWDELLAVLPSAIVAPMIEEPFFRGLFLGVLLRGFRTWPANLISAAIFSIVHFLKAPDLTVTTVHWYSGFIALAHSFSQFRQPMLVLAGFTTLFVIGVILAHARVRTLSLWAPIGLHIGWILASMLFGKIAHREVVALPWLGKSLLVGLVPLAVCLLSWVLLRTWLKYAGVRDT